MEKTKKKRSLTSFSILYILLIVVAILSWIFNGANFAPVTPKGATEPVTSVVGASLSNIVMSVYNGFAGAMDIAIFVLILGGFLGVVAKTGALEAGITRLVKNMKGRELMLIGILMFLFSIGGTTYGMAEETVAFYALITTTMVTAGFDSIVAVSTILLGATSGVLGSTVNPFCVGVAMDTLNAVGIETNNATIIAIGAVLWLSTTFLNMYFVISYAKKIQKDKGSTILSLQEQEDMETFRDDVNKDIEFTTRHKIVLWIFAFSFLIMIVSLIPWGDFGITIFEGWSSFLMGIPLGLWYFPEISVWFFLMTLVVAVIGGIGEKGTVSAFSKGSADILSVVLIIAVARSVSVLMGTTHIDALILDRAANVLNGLPIFLFVPLAFLVYLALSFFIPSTSGLATLSIGVMGGLATKLGYSAEVMIMIFSAAIGILGFITPTSGVVMGGLQIAKVEWKTWIKFMVKPMIACIILCGIILTVAMYICS